MTKANPASSPGDQPPTTDRLISVEQVSALVGLRRGAIYKRVREGDMPAPVRLSGRCSRWKSSQIQAWIAKQGQPTVEEAR